MRTILQWWKCWEQILSVLAPAGPPRLVARPFTLPGASASFGWVLDQALRPHRELRLVTRSFFISVFRIVRAFTTFEIVPERKEGLVRDKIKVHTGKQ